MRRYSVPVPCTCGTMPVQEMRKVMLVKIQDGGYAVIQGRYICPSCGNVPGWDKNIEVWNKLNGGVGNA